MANWQDEDFKAPARILTSYFVVMRKTGAGLEAIVDPSLIRRDIVDMIKSGEYEADKIAYIHHCDFGMLVDVTDELIDEALADREAETRPHPQYVTWDRARALREVV